MMSEDHRTEAECLLEQGMKFPWRVGLVPCGGDLPILVGVKRGGFSIYRGDEPIDHFDLDGRWQRAYRGGRHFLKGLDGTIHVLDRVRENGALVLRRSKLDFAAGVELDALIRAQATQLAGDVLSGKYDPRPPTDPRSKVLSTEDLLELLDRVSTWDSAAWFAHRERYVTACQHGEFLPPECSGAVVVSATRGQAVASFAASASEPAWSASNDEFATMLAGIKRVWSRRLWQAKTIYLAGGECPRQSPEQVEAWLGALRTTFRLKKEADREPALEDPLADQTEPWFESVHMFLHDYSVLMPAPAHWAGYAELGLTRVSLGLESGAAAIRQLYGKRYGNREFAATVAALKTAGLGASVLVLEAAGGAERAGEHFTATASLLQSLPLAAGDLVFLLDETEVLDPQAPQLPFEPIAPADREIQRLRLRQALVALKARGVKVIPYTLDKQWA